MEMTRTNTTSRTLREGCAVFVLSYRRAGRVKTLHLFRECRPIYLLLSSDDPEIRAYHEHYAESVDGIIVFDREREPCMYLDNLTPHGTVLPARNACIRIAREMGYRAICMLDDDYRGIQYRLPTQPMQPTGFVKSIDAISGKTHKSSSHLFRKLVNISFDFVLNTPQVDTFAWGQTGDNVPIDPIDANARQLVKRKAMNVFFMRTDIDYKFMGRLNDDVNTYVHYGNRGKLFLTVIPLRIRQEATQQQPGGLTDTYKEFGTFAKSASTVMVHPSGVQITIGALGRPHHRILSRYTYPRLVR